MIRVLVDSSADYPMEELRAKNIELVPLTVTIGDKNYKDEVELERSSLYEHLLSGKGTITTSQPSPQDFLDVFEDIKEKGDEVICILLSSALSGTYQSACLAKNLVDYDKIYIIDSLTATIAIKIMADHALKRISENMTAKEIVEELETLKGRIRIRAVIDTLKYLYLGGRISKTTAVVGEAVNVKPAITVTADGKVGIIGKYLGVGRAVKDTVKQIKSAKIDRDYPVYVIFSHEDENCMKLRKGLEQIDIMPQGVYQLGSALGVHIGPGAFGIIYVE